MQYFLAADWKIQTENTLFSGILDNIPVWSPNDPTYSAVYVVGVAFVATILVTALVTALRNPGFLRKK